MAVCAWALVSAALATPGWGIGVCVCRCVRSACTPPLLAGVCGVGVGVWARVSAAPRHASLGCCGMRICVRAPLVHRHSPLGCAVWVSPYGFGFRLRPAAPGWGVGVCVCCCARSPCTPPLLAGMCSVCLCVWAQVSAAPRGSWLGVGVCVFVCVPPLYPATPGWGVRCGCVCLGSSFGCAPPLLAGVLGGLCAAVRAPPVPCHSWLGCAVWVCVFGLGFRVRPATAGWGLGVCVFVCVPRLYSTTPGWGVRHGCVLLGSGFGCAPPLLAGVLGCAYFSACSPCTLPLLAGVCGVGGYAWAPLSSAPRHSWLGCWDMCVLVCALRLYPATPGWGVRCGCVCLGSGFGCAPPVLAEALGSACLCACSPCTSPRLAGVGGVGMCSWARVSAAPRHSWLGCWGVCVLVCALRLSPATPGWGVRCGWVCLGSGFSCAPPLLDGVLGCVCAGVRAPPPPRHSWLGCAFWVCVLGLGFWLRPATPGWGVGVCLFVCALRLYPATAGWGLCYVWVGCCLAPVNVRWLVACCARCPGLRHAVAVVAWHLPVCLGCGLRRASLACLVAPHWCAAPCPVRPLSVLRSAFLTPWCLSASRGLAPPDLLGGCAGHVEAGREPGSLCLPLAPAEAGTLGSLRVVPVRGPAMELSLAGPSGVRLGLRALPCFACVDPVTDASGCPYRPSFDGELGRCTGAVSCGRRHRPFRVGGCHTRVPCLCACACFLGRVGRASLPGLFSCDSPVPAAVFVALFVCLAPSGLWLPCLRFVLRFFFLLCAPVDSGVPCFLALEALGLGVLWSSPSLFCLFFFLFSFSPALRGFFFPACCFFFPSFFFSLPIIGFLSVSAKFGKKNYEPSW